MSNTYTAVGFAALGVPQPLVDALTARGLTAPFPIQAATLPDTLAGRDVLGRGRTGSGKTLAFALPVVARLARLVPSAGRVAARTRPGHPRALILAPTRELAGQILATVRPLAEASGLSVMTIFGGVNQSGQVRQLRQGADIVVATPGRLEDLIGQGHASLGDVAVTVLDEADHMADLGFLPAVTRLLAATPAGGQRLLFSATLDHHIDALVKRFLHQPLVHSVDAAASAPAEMTHHVLLVDSPATKRQVVRTLAAGRTRRLLFTRTKHQARKLARDLTADGVPAVELHGNLSQNARERGLKAFADGSVSVMVATDIAARGIHIDDVGLVVHVDPPAEHKAYLHRSGRTARAGHDGDVVTLVLPEQRSDFKALARAARISVEPTPVAGGDHRVAALAGEPALPVPPGEAHPAAATKSAAQPQASGRGKPRGSSGVGRRGATAAPGANRGSSSRNSSSRARAGQAPRTRTEDGSPAQRRTKQPATTGGWGAARGSRNPAAVGDNVVRFSQRGSAGRSRSGNSRRAAV
ncbi:DEAD/DEAH box helicase [Micropruina sonneratiae]|uniref:DEAD/DEAH box helicase n=1 Tax=Micropruina sonneratiae TaxID=2986940 RepID=UPI0022260685|nr:DEAD/DEAH box helicase [Micropruina sp. KQZ13P-5]MCW3158045.1 DEAD/DEAH box helicase [Micropruina sp. KQZ13P-5]